MKVMPETRRVHQIRCIRFTSIYSNRNYQKYQ